MKVFAEQKTSSKPHRRCLCRKVTFPRYNYSTYHVNFKPIKLHITQGSPSGRAPAIAGERAGFTLSVGFAATSPKGRGFFSFIFRLHYTAKCAKNFLEGNIFDGSISTSATKTKINPPIKRNSHRAPSMMQTKICIYYGRSVVGKFLRGMGLGGEGVLSRTPSPPKVFSSLSVGYAATSPKGRGFFSFILTPLYSELW